MYLHRYSNIQYSVSHQFSDIGSHSQLSYAKAMDIQANTLVIGVYKLTLCTCNYAILQYRFNASSHSRLSALASMSTRELRPTCECECEHEHYHTCE